MNLHITYYAFLSKVSMIVSQFWQKISIVSAFLLITMFSFGQTVIDRTVACSCLDNGAPLGQAQFYEELNVSSNINEVWYISSVSGLYQTNSPVPPDLQIPFSIGVNGDTLSSDGMGNYTLEGIHIEDLGYSIELTNGIDTARLSNVLCAFPSGEIVGDVGICENEIITYTVAEPNPDYSYQWAITGQGTIVGPSDEVDFTVEWDEDGVGQETVSLYTEGITGCSQTVYETVEFEKDITLACNNMIQIAVSTECVIDVMPDDILESMKYDDLSYEITVIDPETGNVIPLGTPATDYLFDTLQISIEHLCSNNSCWGNIVFEDKYVPPLICENDTIDCSMNDSPQALGFPLPNTSLVIPNGINTFLVENFDPCGDAYLEYEDVNTELACNQDFSSLVTRSWILTDFSGNSTSCTESIYKTRTTVNDVVFPGDWDGVTNPVLQCDGTFPTLPNGYPDPIYTGSPSGGICDHLNVSYTDLISEICGATYKVVRKWKVVDECQDTVVLNNQLIKIEDDDAPIFECPDDKTFYITNDNSCAANVSVEIPNNYTDCSNVSFSAEIVQVDEFGNIAGTITEMSQAGGNFISPNRELGRHRITFTGEDECGYTSSCNFSVYILDNTPPIAICDLATTIALDNAGNAIVPVSTFDNGSFDNCSIDKIEISRGSNACGASSAFSDNIILCCADVNQDVMVTLRVTDMAGNSNTCMVMVSVQDKKAPQITCPNNITIPCNSDYSDLSIFGDATASDNCSVTISETAEIQVNSCGVGTIYRDFVAIDEAGNESICTQVINLANNNPFVYGDIIWPADYTTNNCVSPELDPDDLPSIYSYPILSVKPCSDPVFDYDDKIYTNANGACQTIFRTWTVIDQCTDDEFEFTQKLNINDNQKPTFVECSDKTLDGIESGDCSYNISYSKSATDDCTTEENLFFSYIIDLFNNGGNDENGTSATISEALPVGTHKVTWRVEDACNNVETCVEFLTILDTKKPTPYCLGGISTVVMPSTGSIAIWASDFDLSSTDNCTSHEDLIFSFSPSQSDNSISFTCEDLEGLDEKFFELEIYVHDEYGNYDFCTSTIRITANTACDTTSSSIMVAGAVFTEDNKMMDKVDLELMEIEQLNIFNAETNSEGNYSFTDLPSMVNYQLTPNYDGDYLNGISTLDIILIQKHILGLEILDSPYKVIAADVNNSESISGADILQLRKLILGHYDAFPANTSWKFVSAKQEFTNNLQPWPVEEQIEVFADNNYMSEDFISVKIGDVNLSRTTNLLEDDFDTRTNATTVLEYEFVIENNVQSLIFSLANEADIFGMQLNLELSDFTGKENINSSVFNKSNMMLNAKKGHLALSYSGAFAQRVSGEILKIDFGPPSPHNLNLNEIGIPNEIYKLKTNGLIGTTRVILREKRHDSKDESMIVYQNVPNPFQDYTDIQFAISTADYVKLEIRNMDGLLLLEKKEYFKEGQNSFKIFNSELPIARSGGVMIYTLINSHDQVSNKMVAIK